MKKTIILTISIILCLVFIILCFKSDILFGSPKKMDLSISQETAVNIGRTLLSDYYDVSFGNNMKFHALDEGTKWRVENVPDYNMMISGGGYFIILRKSDCRVLDIGVED